MARHPEVKEKEIIEAGKTLLDAGKSVNPGAIRAQLGYRGGILRIKNVWTAYESKFKGELFEKGIIETGISDLPLEISDPLAVLFAKVKDAMEQLAIQTFCNTQFVFESRMQALQDEHSKKLKYFSDFEADADESIKRLENELQEEQRESLKLADQNAQLVIENSKLIGRLSVYETEHRGEVAKHANE